MIVLMFLGGIVSAILGALPLGASNVAVINTTIKKNFRSAQKICFSAGIAEVLLSLLALVYHMTVKRFFEDNQWLQITTGIILIGLGTFLMLKNSEKSSKTGKVISDSPWISGFLLALLNPPVVVYWILVFGYLNSSELMLDMSSPLLHLILFFSGVFIGKFLTLYFYGKFSKTLNEKFDNIKSTINKVTGAILILVGLFQVVKVYFL